MRYEGKQRSGKKVQFLCHLLCLNSQTSGLGRLLWNWCSVWKWRREDGKGRRNWRDIDHMFVSTHTHGYPHVTKGNSDQLAHSGTSRTTLKHAAIFLLLFSYLLQSSVPQNHVHQVWSLITSKYFCVAMSHSWKKSLLIFLTFHMPQGGCMTKPEGNILCTLQDVVCTVHS